MVRTGPARHSRLEKSNALYQMGNPRFFRTASTIGTMVAALRYMKTKLNLVFAFAFGLIASLALPPSDAAEAIVGAVAWLGDLHIAEFAVAANALTIMP